MRDRWNINILIYPKPFLYFRFTSLSLNHRLNYAILEPTPYDSSFYLNAYQWISNLYNINFSYLYISFPPSLPITSSLIKELSSKIIIIITYLTTLRISLYHFILPLACTYTYAHTEKNGSGKRISFFPRNMARFVSHGSMHLSTPPLPPPQEKERKNRERDTVQRTGAFLEIGFPRRRRRRQRRPEIERSQSPLLRSKCREKTGSRLFLQSAVDWIVRRPFLRRSRRGKERKGKKEREGKESMCDTRGSPSSFLLVSSARGGSVSWVERYHHQPAPFFQPKRAEPPFPLNPRPRSSPHPPLLPRGFPPPNRFQRASGTRDREIDSGETKKFEFVFNNLRSYFNLRRKRRKRKNSFLEKYACKKIGEVENRGVWIKMVGVYTWFLSSDMLQYWTTCTVVRWTDSLFARHYERSCYRKS